MKLIVIALVVLALSVPAGGAVEAVPAQAGKQEIKKGKVTKPEKKKKKNNLTRKGAQQLRKNAERDAKHHQLEMQRREYQMMQEAQRRGMMQQMQRQQGQNQGQ